MVIFQLFTKFHSLEGYAAYLSLKAQNAFAYFDIIPHIPGGKFTKY